MEIEDWLNGNEFGIKVWKNKYQLNNESFEEWIARVSGGNDAIEKLIREKKFLFGGRVLASRGETTKTLSNCYDIPTADSLTDIFNSNRDMAITFSRGGGCGVNLSTLAPRGATVNNAAKTSSGAVSFAASFNQTTGLIGQEGRRGALMLALSTEHPDLEEFINAKTNTTELTKANLSVMSSDKFMMAVINDQQYELSFTRTTGNTISKTISASNIFSTLVKNNWNWAEPGILYWDHMKKWNLLSENPDFVLDCVNPCAELPLPAYGACNLGSFNLVEYMVNGEFDFNTFKDDIFTVVNAMNEVLDEGIPLHPLKEQMVTVSKWRQIGIGVMGFGDILMMMGIKYGSDESIEFTKLLAKTLLNTAAQASAYLSYLEEPYPGYNKECVMKSAFFNILDNQTKNMIEDYGLRNATLISIAPTGSLSSMLGVCGGSEPLFATGYDRKTESLHGTATSYRINPSIIKYVVYKTNCTEETLPDYVITSMNIDPFDRIRVQAAWQEYIDNSISSTINLPNDASEEVVRQIYIEAWKHQLKGVTIFRDKCKREGILTTEKRPEINTEFEAPDITYGVTERVTTACGHFHCNVSGIDEQPLKLINNATTGCCDANLQALQRICSLALRSGVSADLVTKQLDKVKCNACLGNPKVHVKSCAEGISRVIKRYKKIYVAQAAPEIPQLVNVEKCSSCGHEYEKIAKCGTCPNCGHSKCD